MNKILAIGASLMLLLVASCSENPSGNGATISLSSNIEDDVVNIIITSDAKNLDIVYGVIKKNDLTSIGGLDVLPEYINNELSAGTALTGQPPINYTPDIEYSIEYVAYAASIKKNVINGNIFTITIRNNKQYISYLPEETVSSPYTISDNGRYLVGNIVSLKTSTIFDLATEKDTIINEATLYDITDDATIAVGQAGDRTSAAIYKNGEIIILNPEKTGSLFSITSDGKTAVGYEGDFPIKYENETITKLSLDGKDIDGNKLESGRAIQISENGIICGFVDEGGANLASFWNVDGKLTIIGELPEKKNSVDRENEGWYVFGGFENSEYIRISHNGKYIAGTIMDAIALGENKKDAMYPYILNTETLELHISDPAEFASYSGHPRVEAVTNDGVVILSIAGGAGESSEPYVYTMDGGISTLQNYIETTLAVTPEPKMKGSCVTISANGKIFVLTHQVETGYISEIYSF